MESKNPTISAVRGIAIILVIYGHVIQRTMVPSGEDFFLNPAFKFIYSFHMPLFFFISGYLMALTLRKRHVEEAFRARCKSLLVPFVSWGTLGVISMYVLDQIEGKSLYSQHGFVNDLLINPSIWFLFTLFILSSLLLLSVHLERILGLWAFIVIYAATLSIPYNDYCALYYIKWFYLFYMTGYFFYRYKLRIKNSAVNAGLLTMSAVLFAFLVSCWTKADYIYLNKMSFDVSEFWLEALRVIYRYTVGFVGILIAFHIGKYCSKTRIRSGLETIGVFSLDIYLIQSYIVEGLYPRIVEAAALRFDFTSPLFIAVYAPLMALAFVGLCMLISKLLIRRNLFLNRILLGRRI